MAELASSVITIANVSLVAIDKVINYLKKVNLVNELIENLLKELKALHKITNVIASTYNGGEFDENLDPARYVRQTLRACRARMEALKDLVYDLTRSESGTMRQKWEVKRKVDRASLEIQTLIKDIHKDITSLRIGLECLNTVRTRQISIAIIQMERRVEEVLSQGYRDRKGSAEEELTPIQAALPDWKFSFGPDPELDLQPVSTATSLQSPTLTTSDTSSIPNERTDSVISASGSIPNDTSQEWKDFHYRIGKCGGDEKRIEEIRNLLQQHSDGTSLAQCQDTCHRTPLHIAAQHGDTAVAQVLIAFSADIDAQDSEHASVLDHAIEKKKREFISFLLDQHVNQSLVLERNAADFKRIKQAIKFKKDADASKKDSARKKPAMSTHRSSRSSRRPTQTSIPP